MEFELPATCGEFASLYEVSSYNCYHSDDPIYGWSTPGKLNSSEQAQFSAFYYDPTYTTGVRGRVYNFSVDDDGNFYNVVAGGTSSYNFNSINGAYVPYSVQLPYLPGSSSSVPLDDPTIVWFHLVSIAIFIFMCSVIYRLFFRGWTR